MDAATTIHPIFLSSRDFHRGSCSAEECVSLMYGSEFSNLRYCLHLLCQKCFLRETGKWLVRLRISSFRKFSTEAVWTNDR
jgi:hypothetical protein